MRNSQKILIAVMLLTTACSSDSSDEPQTVRPDQKEISLNPDAQKIVEGTRTTFYDNSLLQTNGFTCSAYKTGTTTPYINERAVSYSDSQWIISGHPYYWPEYNLDFFAYTSVPSNITSLTYSYSGGQRVSFDCDLTSETDTEFVYALAAGQNSTDNGTGVILEFQHPFTRLKLQLAADHPDITIESITFKTVYQQGSYSNGWNSTSNAGNIVWTLNMAYPHSTSIRVLDDSRLVIPQNWGGEIEVTASWTVWGERVSHTLSTTLNNTQNWKPGYSYTYTFTITETDLIVNTERFTEQW